MVKQLRMSVYSGVRSTADLTGSLRVTADVEESFGLFADGRTHLNEGGAYGPSVKCVLC